MSTNVLLLAISTSLLFPFDFLVYISVALVTFFISTIVVVVVFFN